MSDFELEPIPPELVEDLARAIDDRPEHPIPFEWAGADIEDRTLLIWFDAPGDRRYLCTVNLLNPLGPATFYHPGGD